jgi:hypothetical protein
MADQAQLIASLKVRVKLFRAIWFYRKFSNGGVAVRQYMVALMGALLCLTGSAFAAAEDCDRLTDVGQLQARLECLQRNIMALAQETKSLQTELDALKRDATQAVKVGENVRIMIGNLCVVRFYGPESVGVRAPPPKYIGTGDCAVGPAEGATFQIER